MVRAMTRETPHILLLAGSAEGRAIAAALAPRNDLRVTASQLMPARSSGPLPVETLTGRLGAEGLARLVKTRRISAILDATHPFAARISAQARALSADLGLAYGLVLRPEWTPGPQDHWAEYADAAAMAAAFAPGQRIFATTGRDSLNALTQRRDVMIYARRLGTPEPQPDLKTLRYVFDQGPFSTDQEVATLRDFAIDVLAVKNSGGVANFTKLDAARQLGLPVLLLRRPVYGGAAPLRSVTDALNWVERL